MESVKIRLQVLPVSCLTPISINPPDRIELSKLHGLRREIEKTRIIIPLLVATDPTLPKKIFYIVDGNRRFVIAKELKFTQLYCNIIDSPIDKLGALFMSINTQLKFSGFQKLWMMKNNGLFANEKDKNDYKRILDIGGMEIIDLMIERKNAVHNTITWTDTIAKHLGYWPEKDEIRKVLFWLVDLKEQERARMAYSVGYSKSLWKSAITKHQSLPFTKKLRRTLR